MPRFSTSHPPANSAAGYQSQRQVPQARSGPEMRLSPQRGYFTTDELCPLNPSAAGQNKTRAAAGESSVDYKGVPKSLLDPISGGILENPVIAPDGKTYSRQGLLEHLRKNKDKLPNSRLQVSPEELFDHHNAKKAVAEYQERKSGKGPQPGQGKPTCPLSLDDFVEPVIASDGHTYSLAELRRSYEHQTTSPLTREELKPYVYRDLSLITGELVQSGAGASSKIALACTTRAVAAAAPAAVFVGIDALFGEEQNQMVNQLEQSYLPQLLTIAGTCAGAALGIGAGVLLSSNLFAFAIGASIIAHSLIEDEAERLAISILEGRSGP